MSKKQRLKELATLIKDTYALDFVTTAHTKSQQHKLDMEYNPDVVIFKMRYRLKGGDIVQHCPITWLVIDGIDWDNDDPFRIYEEEDHPARGEHVDLMVRLIVRTCGEVLANQPEIKQTLSRMAMNAQARSGHNDKYIITPTNNNSVVFDGIAKMEESKAITGEDVKARIEEIENPAPKPKKK